MTIRSNPQIGIALSFGFVSALASRQFLEASSPVWSMTVGAGVTFLILFFHPQGRTSIELSKDVIQLTDGRDQQDVRPCDVKGYTIAKLTSLRLELHLKDGNRMTHPLDCITSLAVLEKELQAVGIGRITG